MSALISRDSSNSFASDQVSACGLVIILNTHGLHFEL